MSKESRDKQYWKSVALKEIHPEYIDLCEQMHEGKVNRYYLDITDLPPVVLVENIKCKLSLEYEPNKEDEFNWVIRYRDISNNDMKLEFFGKSWDYAVIRAMNYISHTYNKVKPEEPNGYFTSYSLNNKDEYVLIKKVFKINKNIYDENKVWSISCPHCKSTNINTEHYRTSEESWKALAGREGDRYECLDCGYYWDNCYIMS